MKINTQALGLILIIQLFAAALAFAAGSIASGELRRWQEKGESFLLVDVRGNQAFGRKHIQGSINIPGFMLHKKGLSRDETLVLYDGGIGATEGREAAAKLAEAGYAKVYLLEGGLARWEAEGLPLDAPAGVLKGKLVDALTAQELKQALADGLPMVLVDLREPYLFKEGSLPGAVNLAPADLEGESRGWQKEVLVVLVDGADKKAERAAEQLRRAGFKMVRFLYGGYVEWKRDNAS